MSVLAVLGAVVIGAIASGVFTWWLWVYRERTIALERAERAEVEARRERARLLGEQSKLSDVDAWDAFRRNADKLN